MRGAVRPTAPRISAWLRRPVSLNPTRSGSSHELPDVLTPALASRFRVGLTCGMADPDRPDGRQPAIADYAFLSDCHSAALLDRSGTVDWWCLPRFDSPSVLGRLLDPAAGHWALQPVTDFTTERSYIGDTAGAADGL